MAKTYTQKDLGYPRTLTSAVLIVTFSNGERWSVPAQVIVDNRDNYYKDEQEDTANSIKDGKLSNYEITDWTSNNMNWAELLPYAEKLPPKAMPFNYGREWVNAQKEVEKPDA